MSKYILVFLFFCSSVYAVDWIYVNGNSFPSGQSFVSGALPIESAQQPGDLNGYSSKYECRAGGPNCNVDVISLGAKPCDDTITTGDSQSAANAALNNTTDTNTDGTIVICVALGDHTSKGELSADTNGTNLVRRVIKGLGGQLPQDFNASNHSLIEAIEINGDYTILYQIAVDNRGASGRGVDVGIDTSTNNVIVDSVLVEDAESACNGGSVNCVFQNSIFRNRPGTPGNDAHCLGARGDNQQDFWIVNNEIYDCAGDGYQHQDNAGSQSIDECPGCVVENNDMYTTSAMYCDSDGTPNPNGIWSAAENAIDLKAGGSAASPVSIIQNRFWGFKPTDTSCGSTGSNGEAIVIQETTSTNDETRHVLVQNNIFIDTVSGITYPNGTPDRNSIIGNIFYNAESHPDRTIRPINFQAAVNTEVYLNSIVEVDSGDFWLRNSGSGHDIRCNVVIDGQSMEGSAGTGTQMDHQAYFNTTDAGETNKIDQSIVTRANSATYFDGQIMRRNSDPTTCTSFTDPDCYLYIATQSGTSAGSAPTFCVTPDCTFTDGGVTWQAIRGPYQFYRKLRTSPELKVIPYARIYSSAPDFLFCPAGFASRPGVGVDDSQP